MFPENGLRPGRPWSDHRVMMDGMFWELSTGAPWRDLPKEFGPWKTVYERYRAYRAYRADGTFDGILERLQVKLDENGPIDWDLFCVDGNSVRAHRSAAGTQRGGRRESLKTRASGPESRAWTSDPSFSSTRPACSCEIKFPETSSNFGESR
jgi:transposase